MSVHDNAVRKEVGTWTFYVFFVLSVLFEAGLVKLLGFGLGFVVLLVGGAVLGLICYKYTNPSTEARDPLIRAALWCIARRPVLGYLVLGILLGGSLGTAIAYKKLGSTHTVQLTLLSAFLFALTWATIFSL